jgi:uncharacterized Zn finger protein
VVKALKESPRIAKVIEELAEKKHAENNSKSRDIYIKAFEKQVLDITNKMIANISSVNTTRFFGMTVKMILGKMLYYFLLNRYNNCPNNKGTIKG